MGAQSSVDSPITHTLSVSYYNSVVSAEKSEYFWHYMPKYF